MESDEKLVLNYFFTNVDKHIYAFKNMPQALQNYLFAGVSRFPNVRKRFVNLLKKENLIEPLAEAIQAHKNPIEVLSPLNDFAGSRNHELFFKWRHRSAGEGSAVFVVSDDNPIYATGTQQDFYWPVTTMEMSTRYTKDFTVDKIYWDPKIVNSEFYEEAKKILSRNLELYNSGFKVLMDYFEEKRKQEELPIKISVLDSLRVFLPLASHVSLIIGGNSRSVIEHFTRLLAVDDSYIQYYVKEAFTELKKVIPGYFEDLKVEQNIIDRNNKLRALTQDLFSNKFEPVKQNLKMFYEFPMEEQALTQILYPFCSVPFKTVYDKVSDMTENERSQIFKIATQDRINRTNPIRGFETRPIVFELETSWALFKDLKRNRMNLRFQQDMRGGAGYDTPELIAETELKKDYEEAMHDNSDLIEKVYLKYGRLSETIAAQGSRKRYLLTMGPRQLTVLTELRTCGEGDKGYRKIASAMIKLAQEKNPRLFSHIKDNYKFPEK